jgi:hypothetical protein
MKVYIGPYKNWFGPYQFAETICFWAKRDLIEGKPEYVHNLGTWFDSNWVGSVLRWIDKFKKRTIDITIDGYDVWSMDHTLALIVLPMLKKLKEVQHGYCKVDEDDVPENLRGEEQDEVKWNYVLDEIIYAFEKKVDDSWEDEFYPANMKINWEPLKDGFFEMKVEGDTPNYDAIGAVQKRMQNGFVLFGKYFQNLWD